LTVTSIRASTVVEAPPGRVFRYAVDPGNVTKLVEGLREWRVLDGRHEGLGARFAAVFKFGPATYEATLEITEFEADRLITWASTSGANQSLSWRFERDGATAGARTAVEFELGFEPPDGVARALFSLTVEPMLRTRADETVAALKRQVESG
jgi:uncharacterized membrane protein